MRLLGQKIVPQVKKMRRLKLSKLRLCGAGAIYPERNVDMSIIDYLESWKLEKVHIFWVEKTANQMLNNWSGHFNLPNWKVEKKKKQTWIGICFDGIENLFLYWAFSFPGEILYVVVLSW